MAINDKYKQIRTKLFDGNLGKEAQIQNDFLLSLAIKQDLIIESLTSTQVDTFNELYEDWSEWCETARNNAISYYDHKQKLLGNKTVFEEVKEKRNEVTQ